MSDKSLQRFRSDPQRMEVSTIENGRASGSTSAVLPRCKYWDRCYREGPEHRKKYLHPTDVKKVTDVPGARNEERSCVKRERMTGPDDKTKYFQLNKMDAAVPKEERPVRLEKIAISSVGVWTPDPVWLEFDDIRVLLEIKDPKMSRQPGRKQLVEEIVHAVVDKGCRSTSYVKFRGEGRTELEKQIEVQLKQLIFPKNGGVIVKEVIVPAPRFEESKELVIANFEQKKLEDGANAKLIKAQTEGNIELMTARKNLELKKIEAEEELLDADYKIKLADLEGKQKMKKHEANTKLIEAQIEREANIELRIAKKNWELRRIGAEEELLDAEDKVKHAYWKGKLKMAKIENEANAELMTAGKNRALGRITAEEELLVAEDKVKHAYLEAQREAIERQAEIAKYQDSVNFGLKVVEGVFGTVSMARLSIASPAIGAPALPSTSYVPMNPGFPAGGAPGIQSTPTFPALPPASSFSLTR